ncbi:transcription factor S [Thermofilum pendens]|uniref:DNA-directed RNA polymerase, subunit M n=1 Tax=Thermofilum pendens (strain DSM 2475 / Hrk 5) TaxID=368408 RepID=A1RXU9_THEPD|nr:transcription factor S [Thermofilum pendens]ABL78029.1 DNA-directed RNA polymerase, subunit M [Thermofilum pendens Hrk 5]
MEFCPKCGGLMVPSVVNGKKVLRCSRCGYIVEKSNPGTYRVSHRIERTPKDVVTLVDVDVSVLPVVSFKCENCGNDKAYVYELQTRAGDEPATRFYICTKCRKVYREYA